MRSGWLLVQWTARRHLGTWVNVVGHTLDGDTVVVAGADRLVLRRDERRFWPVAQGRTCHAEAAAPLLAAHAEVCRPPVAPPPASDPSTDSEAAPAPPRRAGGRRPPLSSWRVGVVLALAVGIALTASQFVLHRADSRPSVPAKETARAATAGPAPAGTPTAVAPPTSDPAASTATGTAVLPVSEQIAVQERAFNASRARLVTGLPREMSQSVTSVDRLDFDPGRPTIVAQITSPLTIDSSLHDTAWAVTKALVVYWSLETVRRAPNAVPDLRISVNNLRIECPAGVMVRLGYGEASREQWAAECMPAG